MVPEARIELAWTQGPLDFESDLGHIKKDHGRPKDPFWGNATPCRRTPA